VYDVANPVFPSLTSTLIASDASFLNFLGDAVTIDNNEVFLGAEGRQNTPQFDGAVYRYNLNPALPCPTDFNNNGSTDINDLLLVLGSFNHGAGGDTDNDGDTDIDDLLRILSEFGAACP
jgi:hypothetical protein